MDDNGLIPSDESSVRLYMEHTYHFAPSNFTPCTCSTCRFYIKPEEFNEMVRTWSHNDGELRPLTNCRSGNFIYANHDDELPLDGVVFMDYEGYAAYIMVQPGFSCRHWESMEITE